MKKDQSEPLDVVIRGQRAADLAAVTAMRNCQQVRLGTLAVPFHSVERSRLFQEKTAADPNHLLVACVDGEVVGAGAVHCHAAPRISHGGSLGIMLHDEWQGRGIGTKLFAALLDLADNWLGLRRLELSVYCDNAPALALYKAFGFEVEGIEAADVFRDGAFVDSYFMGRLRGDLPRDLSPYPLATATAPHLPFTLRAAEPADAEAVTGIMSSPVVRHGTLRLPYTTLEENRRLVASDESGLRQVVAQAGGEVVGIAVLKPATLRRAHVGDIALLAVHDAWHHRGIGHALLAALLDLADNWLNLRRLTLQVLADNAAAIHLYERLGFRAEGVKRADVFRAGGFADSIAMARAIRG